MNLVKNLFTMKKIINSEFAPKPVGPYNQSVEFNGILYVSGQIALVPSTGELITTNIESETHRVMRNLQNILSEAGMTFDNVLKCTVFVKDMNLYSRINTVYASYFDEKTAPARELVEVANLPKFVNVEISLIAGR